MRSFSEQFAFFLICFLIGSESHTLIWPFKPKFNYSMEKTWHDLQSITVLSQVLKGTNNVKVSCFSLQNSNISSTNLARLTMMSLSEVLFMISFLEMLKLMWKKNNSSTLYLTDVVIGVKMFLYSNTNFIFPGNLIHTPFVDMLGCMTADGFL